MTYVASIFERVLSFSSRELNNFGAPSLITRNTNDVLQVQTLVLLSSTMFVAAPITMIGGIIMALRTDVGLSWLVAVAMPVLAISIFLVIRKMGPLFRRDADPDRHGQPRAARADHRHPGGARVRPRAVRDRRASPRPTPTSLPPPRRWGAMWRRSSRS